ncbi:mannitol dehydrogenase family protein [Xanthomonas campestris]|uniref:mannitol dehydrogenase family protein n=1 Tax=Xanthomonas campestris TaxID=339 RepID=UPI00096ECBDA|nr:mannitol dehydrogenase family protein [Xanthomonas campestris]MCF8828403.1 mannitol dehydrogenase family protein [Xanthomonas campestris pv. raphani]MEA9841202.1 mannitol dehydrogenase family protein [Xanthomonas campestris pv. raphani]MEA9876835.1 mannitol dehydrogenase family protein [Xanthomonas campestris pv. raphani]MEA9894547.1 mannitol dehydrogenase family protein [Xanthomonas campestris pv. raphani]MEA9934669.1 mannitol dehydrogenase family protein [Xanthomonas campestris pv. raphan
MPIPTLSIATLAHLPATVLTPTYTPKHTTIGIVHLGAGAFHRAHQAVYIDDLLADDPAWAICAVSLHNPQVRDALRPQDGLYTLALLDAQSQLRVIGAIAEVLCASDEQPAVLARLADPAVRLVTLTVTEKGYCLAGDTLDLSHPDIVHDLAHPQTPRSAIGYLVAGLHARRQHGRAPFTVLSCDNLADNGSLLRRATLLLAQQRDPALAAWIEQHVSFPRSMVDSITPATDEALRAQVHAQTGLHDAWPIQRERYTQWVIEDRFCNGRPAFERAGVTLSDDIAGYTRAKLRLLNGPHSALAYLGSLLQLETVADAMQHTPLASFVEMLMREDIAPSLAPTPGFDPHRYSEAILARFRNPAIRHLLAQIAWDGSQKIPVRLLGTIADALTAGRRIDRLCLPVAAWLHFVRRQAQEGVALVDPLGDALGTLGRSAIDDAGTAMSTFLALETVFGALAADPRFTESLQAAYAALGKGTPADVDRALRAQRLT